MREPSCGEQVARRRALGGLEQRLDLGRAAAGDGGQQQLALVPEVRVDRAGREPGGAGDVLHPGLLVALLHEHLDRRGDEALPGGGLGRDGGHASKITVITQADKAPPGRRIPAKCRFPCPMRAP